jgi:hypothetical protein
VKKFSARIFIISKINPVVDVPDNVLAYLFKEVGRTRGKIPVKGKLNGHEFTQTVIKYLGAWRLYLNGPMRAGAGIDTGDIAHVEIEYDPAPRTLTMHEALGKALNGNKQARAEFEKLSPSHQQEIIRYLTRLKSEETLTKNVANVIKHLLGEEADTLHAVMRRERPSK